MAVETPSGSIASGATLFGCRIRKSPGIDFCDWLRLAWSYPAILEHGMLVSRPYLAARLSRSGAQPRLCSNTTTVWLAIRLGGCTRPLHRAKCHGRS